MKKILLLTVIIFTVFVSSFEAKAQDVCAACIAPKICTIETITIPDCGDITVVFCYSCDATSNISRVDILEISGICPGYEDAAWDAAFEWIFDNQATLCGNKPCEDGNPRTIEITKPKCADVHFDGSYITIKTNRTQCDLRCTTVYTWCWCNCTPDCDYDGCTPQYVLTYIDSYTSGSGTCDATPYGSGPEYGKYRTDLPLPWILNCTDIGGCE